MENQPDNLESLRIKEETKQAVITALGAGANRDNANQVRNYVQLIRNLNVKRPEQWTMIDGFTNKAAEFAKSGDLKDLE